MFIKDSKTKHLLIYSVSLFILISSLSSCKYPRCKIKTCKTRMVHGHGSKEYTGVVWWKKQNPNTGEGYEEPNYENKK